jgi:hypothetical protein
VRLSGDHVRQVSHIIVPGYFNPPGGSFISGTLIILEPGESMTVYDMGSTDSYRTIANVKGVAYIERHGAARHLLGGNVTRITL